MKTSTPIYKIRRKSDQKFFHYENNWTEYGKVFYKLDAVDWAIGVLCKEFLNNQSLEQFLEQHEIVEYHLTEESINDNSLVGMLLQRKRHKDKIIKLFNEIEKFAPSAFHATSLLESFSKENFYILFAQDISWGNKQSFSDIREYHKDIFKQKCEEFDIKFYRYRTTIMRNQFYLVAAVPNKVDFAKFALIDIFSKKWLINLEEKQTK